MTSGAGPLVPGPDTTGWQSTALVVAQPSEPNEPGGRGEDFGKSSPVGLLVLLLFFIAVAFLVRSMTKHLKRVPTSFDKPVDEPAAEERAEDESTDGDATTEADADVRADVKADVEEKK